MQDLKDYELMAEITARINKLLIEAKDEVLDELLEWHKYWTNQHKEPFNWYGAVKALKVANDCKRPFNVPKASLNKDE